MNFDQSNRCRTLQAKARRWVGSFGIVALLAGLTAVPAMAGTYDGAMGRTNYVVMTGDVNGDGQNDVLFKAVPKIVLIPVDDDLSVPIPIPVPSPTFALISTSYGNYTLVVSPNAEMLASAAWKAANQQVTFAGPSGTTAASVTITAATSDEASFVVSMAADTGLLQLASTTAPAVDPTAPSTSSATPIPVVVDTPHLANADAGSLPGDLSVSPGGAATYGIPLVVPPGSAGVQPTLSLNYSSQSTNGMVGLGWSVGGLSSIHRCGKTIAQDKINGRIGFDASDRLCLDGQRLVRVNGAAPGTDEAANDAAYWATSPAAEYRTEIDSFSRITVITGPSIPGVTGPTLAFKVESKDGRVTTYGSTASSYVLPVMGLINSGLAADGTPMPQPAAKTGARSWAIDSIKDRSGNYVNFSYEQDPATGEHHPTFIRYGGAGLQSHAAVQFVYAARQDAWKKYVDETRNDLRTRIEHILTYVGSNLDGDVVAGGTKVRDYALSYEYSPTSGRSLLNAVQVSARNPQTSIMETLPATTFSWGKPDPNKTPGFAHPASLGASGLWQGAPILTTHNNVAFNGSYLGLNHADYFAFADFENHGFTDALEKRVASPSMAPVPQASINMDPANRANPIPLGAMRNQYRYFHNKGDGTGFAQYNYRISSGENFAVLDTGDFNGDGAPDLLVSTETGGPKICVSPLASTTALVSTSMPITFDCSANRPVVGTNNVYGLPYVVDVNGDGRAGVYSKIDKDTLTAQLCIQGPLQWQCQEEPNPSTTILGYTYTKFGTPPTAADHDYVSFGQMVDFTGTGKPADVRWTKPYYLEYVYQDVDKLYLYEWENTQPKVIVTGFQLPGVPAVKMQPYSYAAYSIVRPEYGGRAPYAFDKPASGAGMAADFNGSGYSSVAFGFKEFHIDASVPGGLAYTRKEMTLCLSTGRAFDCAIRQKYSGANYASVVAVGNFVGDGQPTVLLEPATPGGKYQMCSISGDATGGASDSNMTCHPWDGTPVLDTSSIDDPIYGGHGGTYFMDLLGTGRTQVVVYHPGRFVNNVWVEDGTWEVFEPVDVAVAGQALDRIYQVTNGVGATGTVEYADGIVGGIVSRSASSALTYPQHAVMNPGKLVRRLRLSNGGSRELSARYQYQDAAIDVAGRGFLGFGKVSSTDEKTGLVTTTSYAQVFPYTGMTLTSVTTDSSCVLSDSSSVVTQIAIPQANGVNTVFPFVARGSASRRDLNANGCLNLGTTVTSGVTGPDVQYDTWGNLLNSMATTTTGSDSFTTQTVNTYQPADVAHWVPPLPIRRDVKKTDAAQPASAVTRSVKYTYETDFTGHMKTEQVQPDDTGKSMLLTATYERNPFGLVKSKVVNWFNPQTGVDNVSTHLTGYDDKGRFATSNTVSATSTLNHVETRSYDNATGAATSLTGPNGLTTTWTNDGFGRVQVERGADMNETRSYHKQCQADCPAGAALIEVVEHFNGVNRIAIPQVGYADNAGHVLRTQSWGFDGRVILSEQRYDDLGRPWEADQPRFDGATAFLAHRTSYDVLGRVIKVETLADTGATVATTTDYQGMTTVLTNAKGQKRTDLHDVLGRVKTVTDAMAGVTSFEYDPWNNLTKTTDPRLNVITVSYDDLGRRTALRDPDLGFIEYFVDAAGLTWKQINPVMRAKGWSSTMQYDLLGRMTARLAPDLNSYWVFDTAAMGMGKLAEAYTGTAALKSYQRLHTYDSLGRPSLTTQMLRGGAYTSLPEFDSWGRLIRTTYRRGSDSAKVFDQRYNSYGYMERIERSGLVLWRASVQDAANRVLESALGNGLKQVRVYSDLTGLERDNQIKTATSEMRLHENYDYDVLGSVALRGQNWDLNGFTETFTYDDLNRLKTSQVSGQALQQFDYFADGSIKTKLGVGTGDYQYPAQGAAAIRPHAVQQITGMDGTYSYDDNGNLLSGGGRTAQWTTFDMPVSITKTSPASTSDFVYGPEHQRTTQTRSDGTVVDYAGAQEVETKGGLVTVKTYWPGGLGVEIDRPGAQTELDWTHLDRLGSPIAISDAAGNLREKLAYDAWGKRRTIDSTPIGGTVTPDSLDGVIDNKGFTGHEMLDKLDLVHMNGRVYDPLIGKFLSGDPLVQDPTNGQSYNRYSYVLNNPTNLTDPTGFASCGETDIGSHIARSCDSFEKAAEKCTTACVAGSTDDKGTLTVKATGDGRGNAVKFTGNLTISINAKQGSANNRQRLPDPNRRNSEYAVIGPGLSPNEIYKSQQSGDFLKSFIPGNSTLEGAADIRDGHLMVGIAGIASEVPIVKIAGKLAKLAKTVKYEVGLFNQLKRDSRPFDGLDIHHAMQEHPAGQVVHRYNRLNAAAIALPTGEHRLLSTISGEYSGSARDLLAKDIRDLRNYTNAPDSSLQELIELNKILYPAALSK